MVVERGETLEYPVIGVGRFATLEEAQLEASLHEPKHGGRIVAIHESDSWASKKPVVRGRRGPKSRRGERDTQSITRCCASHHRDFRALPRAN
jgi:hypothetical protein